MSTSVDKSPHELLSRFLQVTFGLSYWFSVLFLVEKLVRLFCLLVKLLSPVRVRFDSHGHITYHDLMNYLAHFYLADFSQTSQVGAFLGDFVKGDQWQSLPDEQQVGILLHRRVDSWIDAWYLEQGLLELFPDKLRRFAGIGLDLYLDHILADTWKNWHSESLDGFSQQTYGELKQGQLSGRAAIVGQNMQKYCWLQSYAEQQIIERALHNISLRFRRPVPLAELYPHLVQSDKALRQALDIALPQLSEGTLTWRNDIRSQLNQ